MNTLHDLRSTLDGHADTLTDTERYVRPVAVRARIRAVRRRRRAGLGGAAALVVVAAVAAAGTLGGTDSVDPAGPTVVGIDVPEKWSIHEFPYELDETATFAGDQDAITLGGDEDDPARAVALFARGLGSGSATLYRDGEPIARELGAEGPEGAELPVPVGSTDTTLSIRFHGVPDGARAGVAVYTATDELPEGISNGTAVFRQVSSGAELLAGGFSEEGASEVTFTFDGRLDEVHLASYCTAAERGLHLNVDVDGEGPVSGLCQREDDRDAGTAWVSFPDDDGPARTHTVRAYLTRSGSDEPVSSPDSVVGAAVYHRLAAPLPVAGTTVAATTEYAGRLWTLDRVIERQDARLVADDTDLLLGLVTEGRMAYVEWDGELSAGRSAYISSLDEAATLMGGVLLRGDAYDVQMATRGGDVTRGALLVYRPE